MKNGIKGHIIFPDLLQYIIELNDLQFIYFKVLGKIQQLLKKIGTKEENQITFSELYTSNKPQKVLQTRIEQLNKQKTPQSNTEIKSLKLLKLYLNKNRILQEKISFLIENFSELIVKLKSKKECQILITSLSLIIKKRQKFQLKQINKNNQLSKNLEQLAEYQPENLKYRTLIHILDQKPLFSQQNDSCGQTIKIKEEEDILQTQYYQYLYYQMYQQYWYYSQIQYYSPMCNYQCAQQ